MEIIIPFKTPSVNHLYFIWNNRKIMTKEAKELRKQIEEIMDRNKLVNDLKDGKLKIRVEIYENWYTKKGDVRKKDISNREKFLVDTVFGFLCLDDKYIFEHTMKKIQSDEEKAVITIWN